MGELRERLEKLLAVDCGDESNHCIDLAIASAAFLEATRTTPPVTSDEVVDEEYRKELRGILADCSEFLADIDGALSDRCEAMLSQVVAEDSERREIARFRRGAALAADAHPSFTSQ